MTYETVAAVAHSAAEKETAALCCQNGGVH